tara:strand:- start:2971 stop:3132 length:162 start_codon:yes stop_codon:yes gene_type:complete
MHKALKTIEFFNECSDVFTDSEKQQIMEDWIKEYEEYLLERLESVKADQAIKK